MEKSAIRPATRFDTIEISLIRQINLLATPLSIDLGLGEPNVEPDDAFRKLAVRAAAEGSWHYTANAGNISLRQAIGTYLDAPYDPKTEICVTPGTQEALYAIAQAYLGEGDEVLVPDPGFLSYDAVSRLAGARVGRYPLDPEQWRIDVAELDRQLTDRTKIVFVNSPSNPTGGVESRETLQQIARLADERGFLVVSDEVYREIYYDGEVPPTMLGMSDNVIVVGGMSKSHAMTGLRLGWVFAREEVMRTIIKSHLYIATCASAFTQRLAELTLNDRDFNTRWLDSVRAKFEEQRAGALHAIEHVLHTSIRPPRGAFYCFVPVPTCDTVGLAKALATEAAVLTVPGVAFGPQGEGFLRISYAAKLEDINRGFERIAEYLREIGR